MLLVTLVVLSVLVASMAGFAPRAMADASEDGTNAGDVELEFTSVADLAGKRIGITNESYFDQLLLDNVKGVSQNDIYYFNNNPETIGALQSGKVDAVVNDSPLAQLAVNKNDGIALLPEYVVDDRYGYVLEKDSNLTPKFNERLKAYREDGTLDRLKEKWMDADDSKKTMPDQPKDGPNGTIVVATSIDNEPINYLKDDRMHGMCIELLELIASFERTFVVEDRWKLILGGLGGHVADITRLGGGGTLARFPVRAGPPQEGGRHRRQDHPHRRES